MDLEAFVMYLEKRINESHEHYDEKLGLVFYPCNKAIDKGLEKSMA